MAAPIQFDTGYRIQRGEMRTAVDRALPHRRSYLGFTVGLIATVIVVLSALGWWLVQSGMVHVWWFLQSGSLQVQLRWS